MRCSRGSSAADRRRRPDAASGGADRRRLLSSMRRRRKSSKSNRPCPDPVSSGSVGTTAGIAAATSGIVDIGDVHLTATIDGTAAIGNVALTVISMSAAAGDKRHDLNPS